MCLCKGTRTQAADRLPKPSLRAENGSVVPHGGAVTLRCRGSWEAEDWQLEKRGGYKWSPKAGRPAGNEVEFSLPSVTPHNAGTYQCLYRHSSSWWSERSDPLELVVTGKAHPPPRLGSLRVSTALGPSSAQPGPECPSGSALP
uniref:Ig-like domain-containing protein n=1 Tax=Monodelphis domestica TaxID=13616 RepID=A0A5F8GV67_MONDO